MPKLNPALQPDQVTPEGGVQSFLRSIGSVRHVLNTLAGMGIKHTRHHVERWIRENQMPLHAHDAMKLLAKSESKVEAAGGNMEFYVNGEFIGTLELPRSVTCIVRKRIKPL